MLYKNKKFYNQKHFRIKNNLLLFDARHSYCEPSCFKASCKWNWFDLEICLLQACHNWMVTEIFFNGGPHKCSHKGNVTNGVEVFHDNSLNSTGSHIS